MKTIIKAGTNLKPSAVELAGRELAGQAAAEGFVLLENDGALPLKRQKIALYGSGARKTVKGGTGSGAVRERYSVTIEQGLLNAGLKITTTDWLDRFDRYYQETYASYCEDVEQRVTGIRDFHTILGLCGRFEHPTGIPVTGEDIENSRTDTAIYVLARQAGEGQDREDKQGDYRLDDLEKENLKRVSEGYSDFIVVINCGGVLDVSFLDEIHVSALVYYSQGGEEGGNALADVLTGRENFSGHLATGWAYDFGDIPSNSTYSYLGRDPYVQEYNEGIYVGYRYFESFGVAPRYAFGYGLSYTTFHTELTHISQVKDRILLDITVRNTGDRAGKEVALCYAAIPFGTDGAEAKRLAAFQKTDTIEPGELWRSTMEVPLDALTKYREKSASWFLEAGDYLLHLGGAVNRTEPAAVLSLKQEFTTELCTPVCRPERPVEEIVPPARQQEKVDSGVPRLELDLTGLETVTHSYDDPVEEDNEYTSLADKMTVRQLATLVCGGGTSPGVMQVSAPGASGSTTGELYEEWGIPNVILADGPAGLNLTGQVVELPDGSIRAANVPENLENYKRYLFGFNKVALTSRMARPEDGTPHYQYATAWPCSQLLAQTFHTELMERIGDTVGREMEQFGVTVWLAPGMNIHRNPLCGRTFEYYSEDPLVSGKMAAALVRGVQSHPGRAMSIKHFAANSCELNRNESSSNLSERALREIYLKGFAIAVKESSPRTVMAAYNKINGVYATNNRDLLVKVLRQEWGFQGLVMSDWDAMKAQRDDCGKAATGDILKAHAAQCDLVMPGRADQIEALVKGVEQGEVDVADLKRSAVRVLKLVAENRVLEWRK